jgi:hypothetical protein
MDLGFVRYLKNKTKREKRIHKQYAKDREQHKKDYLAGDSAFYRKRRDRRKEIQTSLEMLIVATLISALLYALLSI